MKPGETIRFACGECDIAFDLRVAPPSEWEEGMECDATDEFEPICSPFCGAQSSKLKRPHDRADAVDSPV
jgi:hypothetical protein